MSMLNHFFDYKPEVLALDEKAMELCQPYFRHMEEIRDYNQLKMLKAFADTQSQVTPPYRAICGVIPLPPSSAPPAPSAARFPSGQAPLRGGW